MSDFTILASKSIKGIVIIFLISLCAFPRCILFMGDETVTYSMGFPLEMLQFNFGHETIALSVQNILSDILCCVGLFLFWRLVLFKNPNPHVERTEIRFLNISLILAITALAGMVLLLTSNCRESKTAKGIYLFRLWYFSSLASLVVFALTIVYPGISRFISGARRSKQESKNDEN